MALKDNSLVSTEENSKPVQGQEVENTGLLNSLSRLRGIQNTETSRSMPIAPERENNRVTRLETLNSAVLEVASSGNTFLVHRYLEQGGSMNATCRESGITALHLAASNGHKGLVKALKDKGANVAARDKLGRQPVHLAAWNGYINVLTLFTREELSSPILRLKELINETDLDSENHYHETVLDISDNWTEGSTPLHLACKKSNEICVKFLLEAGVCVDIVDSKGLSALDVWIMNFSHSSSPPEMPNNSYTNDQENRIAKPIVRYNSLPNNNPNDGKSPVNYTGNHLRSTRNDYVRNNTSLISNVRLLLAEMSPMQLNDECTHGQTNALHSAVQSNNLALISLLLQNNYWILARNECNDTPIHIAVKSKLIEPLKLLLPRLEDASTVINEKNSTGINIFHLAVMSDWTEGVSLMLENGADVKISCSAKDNVFHLAAERGNARMLRKLLSVPDSKMVLDNKDSSDFSPLCKAVFEGYIECVKLLVENGADSNIVLPGKKSLIYLTVENNFSDLLNYLLNKTSAEKLKDCPCSSNLGGLTPLQSASKLGCKECVGILLKTGCDLRLAPIDGPDMGSMPLHLAARYGHESVVALILNKDIDVLTLKDSRGWNPLHIAANNGHSNCVSTMIEYGADLTDHVIDEKGICMNGVEAIINCIPQPTEFFMHKLDTFIKTNDYTIHDPKNEIRVKFDLLVPRKRSYEQFQVLKTVLNYGKENIQEQFMLHPVVQSFLHLKWTQLKLFYFIIMAFYILFSLFLAGCCDLLQKQVTNNIAKIVQGVHCVIFIQFVSNLLNEHLYLKHNLKYKLYLTFIPWLLCFYFGGMLVGATVDDEQWQLRCFPAFSVFLAWIELLVLITNYSDWGFYVMIFFRVVIKVFKVLMMCTFFLLGFSASFIILFVERGSFSAVMQFIIKAFDNENKLKNIGGFDGQSFVGRDMLIFFVILVAVGLMDLTIGLIWRETDIRKIEERSHLLANQVLFLSSLEVLVRSLLINNWVPSKVRNWVENRCATVPEVIIKAGGPAIVSNGSCLPQYLKAAIIEKVLYLNYKKDESDTSLNYIAMRLERLGNRLL